MERTDEQVPAVAMKPAGKITGTLSVEEELRPGSSTHIRQLTGIRALAAVWVLLFHFRPEILKAFGFLRHLAPVFNVGYLGVDLFFVLSGFILTHTYIGRMSSGGWTLKRAGGLLWLRLSRIWPLMAFMLLVWAGYLTFTQAKPPLDPARFLQHATLVQGWFVAPDNLNPIDWSLSAEWLAYLVFAFAVVPLAKMMAYASSRALVFMAVACVLPMIFVGFSLEDGSDLMLAGNGVIPGIIPLRVLTEFFGGAIVSVLVMRHAGRKMPWFLKPSAVLAAIIVLVYTAGLFTERRPRLGVDPLLYGQPVWGTSETVLVLPLFLLLIGSLAMSKRDPLTRVLSTRLLVWGGRVSFALYLVHWLFVDAVRRVVADVFKMQDVPENWMTLQYRVTVVVTIALTVLAAYLLYRFVEEPCRRTMRQMLPSSMDISPAVQAK
jgi:peptidoglycan/LPS O-acetylase OafA/YrhL